jgi:hypothetical protein
MPVWLTFLNFEIAASDITSRCRLKWPIGELNFLQSTRTPNIQYSSTFQRASRQVGLQGSKGSLWPDFHADQYFDLCFV